MTRLSQLADQRVDELLALHGFGPSSYRIAPCSDGRARVGFPEPHELTEEVVRDWVERSCAAQGLPVKVTDATVLWRVALLFRRAAPG